MWCVRAEKAQICLKLCGFCWLGFWWCLQRRAGWLDLARCFALGGLRSLMVMMGGGWMCACVSDVMAGLGAV